MSRFCKVFLCLFFLSYTFAEQDQVVVLANSNSTESVELAEFYVEQRALPQRNIISIPMPKGQTITWEQFSKTIYNPLQDKLIDKGFVNGSTGNVFDGLGREQKVVFDHNIKYLVICRGVPHRIKNQPEKIPPKLPANFPKQFRTLAAAVDSELAFLPSAGMPAVGMLANPFFEGKPLSIFDKQKVFRVSRASMVPL